MRVTPLGLWLRIIVNEKLLNLEKTTSSALSVLLINPWVWHRKLTAFTVDGTFNVIKIKTEKPLRCLNNSQLLQSLKR